MLVIGAIFGVGGLVVSTISAYVLYRVADVAQKNLETAGRESSERIAVLSTQGEEQRKETALANERAAAATQKAEEARLELEKLKMPRLLSAEQQARIVGKLKSFGVPYSMALQPDPEPIALANQIEATLNASGWKRQKWEDKGLMRFSKPNDPTDIPMGLVYIVGVRIEIALSKKAEWEAAAVALRDALTAEGIDVTASADVGAEADAIHIAIGKKP